MISFEVFNDSNRATTIKDVEITHENGNSIDFLPNFNPYEFYNIKAKGMLMKPMVNNSEYQRPFSNDEVVPANSSKEYSYYLKNFDNPLVLNVKAEQPIHWFKKEKLFIINFNKSN